jgi:hypothetical protein
MTTNVDQPKARDAKPAQPGGAHDLKSMPMAQLQAQLASSPDGVHGEFPIREHSWPVSGSW